MSTSYMKALYTSYQFNVGLKMDLKVSCSLTTVMSDLCTIIVGLDTKKTWVIISACQDNLPHKWDSCYNHKHMPNRWDGKL